MSNSSVIQLGQGMYFEDFSIGQKLQSVGRTIFGDAARAWLTGRISDEAAIADMADRFATLCAAWDAA